MADETPTQREARLDAVLAEYLSAVDAGRAPQMEHWLAAHPEFAGELRQFLDDQRRFAQAAGLAASAHEERTAALQRPLAHPLDAPTLGRAPSPENAPLGTLRYFGDYELLEEIARGGMGVVYRTRQKNLKRIVALKMILVGQLANAEEVKRFYAEAQAAAKLEHPHIVPIFEIGQQEGQHYFTMAFIDGESLAHRVAREVLPPREAAHILEQVARAIAYAHVEGVVHRDLKPANILLDRAGQPHVTDFGLAKRVADDGAQASAQLTATGQVLGTPSYMPPEQAAGKSDAVGPLADVYSLGAVLYCLLTGRPPFQAASPLDTLLQVLQDEPVSPRQLNSSVPRDLETICLKCLEKDPARRYGSAADLADELHRYLQGEPIRARPLGLCEIAVRRAKKHRRLWLTSAAAIAATFAFVTASVFGWRAYVSVNQGNLALLTAGLPLAATVRGVGQEETLQSVTVPTDQPLSLWHDEYVIEVVGPGLPSATYLTAVDARHAGEAALDLAADRLWAPIVLDPLDSLTPVQFGPRTDLILLEHGFDGATLRRLRGDTLQSVWSVATHQIQSATADSGLHTTWPDLVHQWANNFGPRPLFLDRAELLDADGVEDPLLCWPLQQQAACAAISGANGSLLWLNVAPENAHLAAPPLTAKVNGDAHLDVLLFTYEPSLGTLDVRAISGSDGSTLWRRSLDDVAPLRTTSSNTTTSYSYGAYRFPYVLTLAKYRRRAILVATTDRQAVGLHLEDGQPAWPTLPLGGLAAARPQFVDLNGDGGEEILFAVLAGQEVRDFVPQVDFKTQTLGADAPLWSVELVCPEESSARADELAAAPWTLPVDLDGDGLPELVVPQEATANGLRQSSLSLAVLDGSTGRARWQQTLFPRQRGEWKALLDLADADGDGQREIVVVSVGPDSGFDYQQVRLYVDVLSGRAGGRLATWVGPVVRSHTGGFSAELKFESARWWLPTADRQPQLLIALRSDQTGVRQTELLLVAPLAGRQTGQVQDVMDWHVADFNADGLPDLGVMRSSLDGQAYQVFPSAAPVAWRRLARLQPGQDYDDDGLCDALEVAADGRQFVRLVSGRDGSPLQTWSVEWPTPDVTEPFRIVAPALPAGDFDRDGVADMLATSYVGANAWNPAAGETTLPLPLQAYSVGRRRSLWTTPTWTAPEEIVERLPQEAGISGLQFAFHDLENDGLPEIVCAFRVRWREANWWGQTGQLWLAVISAHDGAVRWQRPLGGIRKLPSDVDGRELLWLTTPHMLDLDGDGGADLVGLAAEGTTDDYPPAAFALDLHALSGRTGQPLWPARRLAMTVGTLQEEILRKVPAPVAVSLDPARPPVVLAAESILDAQATADAGLRTIRVNAIDGPSGELRWEHAWQSAGANYEWLAPQIQFAAVDLAGDGRRVVCVRDYDNTPDTGGERLHFLDANGQPIHTAHGPKSWNYDPTATRLWAIDLDGDGAEELVYSAENTLRAWGDVQTPLWERALPGAGYLNDFRLQGGRVQLIALADRAFVGIDGPTGDILWRCEGLRRQRDSAAQMWHMPSSRSDEPDRVLGAAAASEMCVALPTNVAAGYDPFAALPRIVPRPTADPRLVRPLPWQYGSLGPQFAWIAACSLALVVLPGAAGYWLFRRGRWSLKSWLCAPVLAAYWITATRLLVSAPLLFGQARLSAGEAWLTSLSGLFLLAFPFLLGALLWRRRWRAARNLLIASVVCGFALGTLGVWQVSRTLAEGESLAGPFEHWENLWLPATVFAGWLGLIYLAGAGLWRRGRSAPRPSAQARGAARPRAVVAGSVALATGSAAGLATAFLAYRQTRVETISLAYLASLAGLALTAIALVRFGLARLRKAADGGTPARLVLGLALLGGIIGCAFSVLTMHASVGAIGNREYELTLRIGGAQFALDRGSLAVLDVEMMTLVAGLGLLCNAGGALCGALCGLAIGRLWSWRGEVAG